MTSFGFRHAGYGHVRLSCGPQARSNGSPPEVDQSNNTELVQLCIRLIALDDLVIALLADAIEPQRTLARGVAETVVPRLGFTR